MKTKMKKLNLEAFLNLKGSKLIIAEILCVVSLFTISCNDREQIKDDLNNYQEASISVPTLATVHRGRLVYSSLEDFNSEMNSLQLDKEISDSLIITPFEDMSDDSLSEFIHESGIKFHDIYVDFENQFTGWSSLLVKLEDEVDIWLDNETLDKSAYPFNGYNIDPLEFPLLNEEAEIIVAGNGYKYWNGKLIRINGLTYLDSIMSIDDICDVMDDIDSGLEDPDDTTSTRQTLGIFDVLGNNPPGPGCAARGVEERSDFEEHPNHKLYWQIQLNNNLLGCAGTARTRNFRKKNIGNGWIRYVTDCEVKVGGHSVNSSCVKSPFASKLEQKRRIDIFVRMSTQQCKALSGDVKGWHKGAAGITKESVILF